MLKVTSLHKQYGEIKALSDINFTVEKGEIAALLGPSGSGKSTLLRCLCRLEQPSSGNIAFDNQDIAAMPAHATGMVFQSYNLFPHMTCLENITFAAKRHGIERLHGFNSDKPSKVGEIGMSLLDQFGLKDRATAYPHQLSGGQRQRIAICRALIMNPPLLLFDEPTSALDPERVKDVTALIRGLGGKERTIIISTHELRVAQLASDKVLFLDQGQLVESAATASFFANPQSERGKQFLLNLMN